MFPFPSSGLELFHPFPAIELDPNNRELAKRDKDFNKLWEERTQCQNPVMNVKLKITRFCNWLKSLRLYFWLEVFR